ncbi:MAG: hypothetical protein GXP13_02585 [Gammaproteobacteria bacterium]|nr:hypothetical protein [Gammaproteobacteria bacterium]
MTNIVITLDQLRGMIGVAVIHQGIPCKIVEVLEDGPSLVLINIDESHIQVNQYGNPLRKVPQTFTVPVLNSAGDEIHPAYLALDLLDHNDRPE